MKFTTMLIVAVIVFGLCFLVDKGFSKAFRGKAQHQSGLSVRLNKRYGSFGIISTVLGISAVIMGVKDTLFLLISGILLILMGIALIVYYMTFGIFYDADSFILTTFGKRSQVYSYKDIRAQQLYVASGNVVVELHMEDGRTVQLHRAMEGLYPFLDHAYSAWLRQTGRKEEDCPFHDPSNSCWFPPVEG